MEKLVLKYFAPYFPYGLKMINNKSGRIITVNGYSINLIDNISIECLEECNSYDLDIWPFTPVLRPLSETTLLIPLENGIIPLHALLEASCFDISVMEEDYIQSFASQFVDYELMMYKDVVMLFEWHFDVFGLIQAGLAIDINAL